MPRKKSFLNSLARTAREIDKAQKAQLRKQKQAMREAERAQKAYARALKQEEKEMKRLYTEARIAKVEEQNEQLQQTMLKLENILKDTLTVDDYIDLNTLKQKPPIQPLPEKKPVLDLYLPEKLTFLQGLVPGAKRKHREAVEVAKALHKKALKQYEFSEKKQAEFLKRKQQEVATHNAEIEEFKKELVEGNPDAIINYFTLVLEASSYPDGFPQHAKIAFVPESKQLVVEYDLPTLEIVPEVKTYKYVKTRDDITTTALPATQRKRLYASVIAQVTIRTLHEIFEADRLTNIESIVFNGHVDSIDLSTGQPVRPCLITVRTTRDSFEALDLHHVDPQMCLKGLSASVSKKPTELAPVRPVLEFNMVDSRFVEETDVLSELDHRQNLMELTPVEFENLITNLFSKMGLETKQTQASRDGGVDCVAYDPRPIFGGKVVIQAKRYKNTVGVSAVRDLYGTVQNEGASKGILVTTSGYGKASDEFANGKPLELLSGTHLLYLLEEYADLEAKIEMLEDWSDPEVDEP